MPVYAIRREVGDITQEDVDAASYRAIVCAYQFTGLRWITSFWDRPKGELLCIYEALGPDQLLEHAHHSRIPCDEIREVTPFGPEAYLHG